MVEPLLLAQDVRSHRRTPTRFLPRRPPCITRLPGDPRRHADELLLVVSQVPSDNPNARTLVTSYRTRVARYPVGGIKLPVDGVISVQPTDFVNGCAPAFPPDAGL